MISCGLLGSLLDPKIQDINTAALAGCNFHSSTPHHLPPEYDDIQWVLTTNDISDFLNTLYTGPDTGLRHKTHMRTRVDHRGLDHTDVLIYCLRDPMLPRIRQGYQAGLLHPTTHILRRFSLRATSRGDPLSGTRWPERLNMSWMRKMPR